MKRMLIPILSAALMITVGVTLAGCQEEQSSTLPYISSKDEIYYATDDMPAQTEPVTADKSKKDSKQSSVNPDSEQIANDTTYPTAISQSNISPNNSNGGNNSSSKPSNPVTLSASSIDLKVGQSKSITVSLDIDQTGTSSYTAETSNNNAYVSCSGSEITITGQKPGSTTIIVKSGGKKASCNVIIIGSQTNEQSTNITDDTEVKYSKLCTDYYQAKITAGVNIDFYDSGNGAVYSSSLNKDDETEVIEVPYSDLKDKKVSVNSLVNDLCKQFRDEMQRADDREEFDIKNYRINCYSEKQNNNEYIIYFCYQRL